MAKAINQNADAFANFFKPGAEAIAPTQMRAESVKRLDEMAAAFGLSPKALTAVREQANAMPADDVPTFLSKAVVALDKRQLFARPLDPEALSALAKQLRPPEEAKAPAPAPEPAPAPAPAPAPEAQPAADLVAEPAPAPALPQSKRTPEEALASMERQAAQDEADTKQAGRMADVDFEPRDATDILSPKGTPWASKVGANKRLKEIGTGRLARVNTGWVIKPAEGSTSAVDPVGDGAAGPADAGRGPGGEQLREQRDGDVAGNAGPADEPGVVSVGDAAVPPADGGRDAAALSEPAPFTTGDTFTLAGKAYTVTKAGPKSAVIAGEDGKRRTVTPDGKTWAAMLEQKTSAAVPEQTAEAAPSQAPAPAAVAGAAAEPTDLPAAGPTPAPVEGDGVAPAPVSSPASEKTTPAAEGGSSPAQAESAAPAPAPDLAGARAELRAAMGQVDAVNEQWESLYRDALPYFSGDGPSRKLSPNAPDDINARAKQCLRPRKRAAA